MTGCECDTTLITVLAISAIAAISAGTRGLYLILRQLEKMEHGG